MNELAILIGLISFPGLLATMLSDTLLVHVERWSNFQYLVYTFVFGVASYVVLQVVVWALSSCNLHLPFLTGAPDLTLWSTLLTGKELRFTEVAWASVIAPILSIFVTVCVNKKFIHRLSQWLGISNKYGDENLFSYFLNSPDVDWVYVRDKQGQLTYFGRVRSYSESKDVQEVLLTDVSVYEYENSEHVYDLKSIYLSKPLGSFVIELPKDDEEDTHDKRTAGTIA